MDEELSLEDQIAELKWDLERNEAAFKALSRENQKLQSRNFELEDWHQRNFTKVKESEEWRKKFELSVHTPEYKQDAEKAYDRGYHAARQKMSAWFIQVGQDMKAELLEDKENNE
jgi:regulator of replication initiation timing